MNNKEFDDIIKKKLESLNSGSAVNGWDTFREKWEQSSPSSGIVNSDKKEDPKVDELFDAKVKQNMNGLRMPLNSAHWVRLKAQLEAEALFKKRLFVAKTVEILILAFIVVGILNVMPIQNEIYQIPVFDVPMVEAIQVDKATAEKYQQDTNQKTEERSLISDKFITSLTNVDVGSFFKKEETNTSINFIQNHDSEIKSSIIAPTLNPNSKLLFPFLIEPSQKRNLTQDNFQDQKIDQITSVIQADIPQLMIPNRPIGYPDITLGSIKNKSSENSYLSLAIGPKVNLVNSPFDPVYEIDPYNTLNTNFNISARIHKELGPIEFYAGLGYSKTSYQPKIIEEIYKNQNQQYNQASLENIGFNTFNVPVGVIYNLLDKDNYQIYASAGVDVNLIAQADYEVYDLPAAGFRGAPSTGTKPPLNSGKPEINQRALLSQKEFKNGILNGGSLRDNLYATASIGVGLIKNVSQNTSLFVEPKYSHFISSQGLGPNLDKVHAVSFDLGVRYQLN